jgi:hypothetical protein
MGPNECFRAVSVFQQQSAGDLLTRLHALAAVADPEPPALDDLPPSLVDRFVGSSGHAHGVGREDRLFARGESGPRGGPICQAAFGTE